MEKKTANEQLCSKLTIFLKIVKSLLHKVHETTSILSAEEFIGFIRCNQFGQECLFGSYISNISAMKKVQTTLLQVCTFLKRMGTKILCAKVAFICQLWTFERHLSEIQWFYVLVYWICLRNDTVNGQKEVFTIF